MLRLKGATITRIQEELHRMETQQSRAGQQVAMEEFVEALIPILEEAGIGFEHAVVR